MKKAQKILDLPVIETGSRPKVVLIGNGINRMFHRDSWKNIIENALARNRSPYIYSEINDLPATMQIVLACNNKGVNLEAKHIAKELREDIKKISEEEAELLTSILSLPADGILTTNYSLEFEYAAERISNMSDYRKLRFFTKELTRTEEQFVLYQRSEVHSQNGGQRIWHIHGDINKSSSIILGHYYYGKLQARIQDRIRYLCKEYRMARAADQPFKPMSWVDYFMLGDVYAFGIGLDTAEQDLWWLLACKQIEFPETKFVYYKPEKDISGTTKKMLLAYDALPVTDIQRKEDDYKSYYLDVIKDIRGRMQKS